MKRVFIILSSAFGIVLVALSLLYLERAHVLSAILTSKMGNTVILDSVDFKDGKYISLANLSITNPEGFQTNHALKVSSIRLSAPYRNYFQDVININSIVLEEILLSIDFQGKVTNWEVLMKQLDSQPEYTKTSTSYTMIKSLSFKRLHIRITKNSNISQEYELKDITLHNVRTKEGELTRRVTQAILSQIMYNIQGIINIPMNTTQEALDLFNPFSKPKAGQ